MSAGGARLDRLHAGLTARDRVLLLHRALLADEKEDPAIRATMPREQRPEFNHYVALANSVLHVITPRALALDYEVEALWLRFLLLGTQVLWGIDRSALLFNASLLATIPIPQDQYEQELAEERHERLTLRDIVEMVQVFGTEESAAAARQAERDVRAAVKSGELPSRRRGRGCRAWRAARLDARVAGAASRLGLALRADSRGRARPELAATVSRRVDARASGPRAVPSSARATGHVRRRGRSAARRGAPPRTTLTGLAPRDPAPWRSLERVHLPDAPLTITKLIREGAER